MYAELARDLSGLKAAFAASHAGHAHAQEAVPLAMAGFGPGHLGAIHEFAGANPIYSGSRRAEISGISCAVYEGDMGSYWLDSTKHGASCQPFYPTWMTSAYALASMARELGYRELVDVGSGDGRIAYCGAVCGLEPRSVEIDGALAGLQRDISAATGRVMGTVCCDALGADYAGMGLSRPVFFMGGLAQMGGDVLADGVIGRLRESGIRAGLVLPGSRSRRRLSAGGGHGWEATIERHGLEVDGEVSLPTSWTLDQEEGTPYVHARLDLEKAA